MCETKKVAKTVYSCECEDYCIPGPSVRCKVPCNGPDGCHTSHCTVWKPTCGQVRTRKKLIAKDETKEVPSYRCVVEEVCARCGHCAHKTEYPPAEEPAAALALAGDAARTAEVAWASDDGQAAGAPSPVVSIRAAAAIHGAIPIRAAVPIHGSVAPCAAEVAAAPAQGVSIPPVADEINPDDPQARKALLDRIFRRNRGMGQITPPGRAP